MATHSSIFAWRIQSQSTLNSSLWLIPKYHYPLFFDYFDSMITELTDLFYALKDTDNCMNIVLNSLTYKDV